MNALIEVGYLLTTVTFLGGLKFMSSPKYAKAGNTLAAIGMILAVLCTFWLLTSQTVPTINLLIVFGAILLGSVGGKIMAAKVEMTAMPQLVSLFNATGGGCAMLLGIVEAIQIKENPTSLGMQILLLLGLVTGAVAASGSVVAYGKLAGKIKDNRKGIIVLGSRVLLISIIVIPLLYFLGGIPLSFEVIAYVMAAIALLYGVLFVLPIGGADMPVVISLLNSITGIATALAGLVYANKAMIAGGIFVGAAGILLTLLMCKAMNRSLLKVLAGKFKKGKVAESTEAQNIKEIAVSETAMQLSFANKIAIIPGYGLAVAQGQHLCSQLHQLLEKQDTQVDFIIHPVAGRMPGHMNVLLAEANIDYEYLKEMDQVNSDMDKYDVVLIIGANDVVNPAAEINPDSPIYGMPIIKAHKSKQVVVMKRGMSKGYAGVANDLFGMNNCSLLFGDAKDSLQNLINQLKLL
ncbi:NAD(P)(+) transhydrogenase (Re/Si-specific) subunit beta [Marixanthomonas sp. SCSIO 43207]|uniref:NAD(P)(+) transhydrogenase (Re/Si-specific) subunit beta n=1 Tax=Marixanthomonas sp. SCSIO 43207 TaxID=2779360 RepID=UPI001CA91F4B|nr:NAD(P)(+) transhydrogenase (Re/Si-specific) subunit beta [Marixanthomonas sp. SCSIO 43207]UAB80100.1 NAD(P)(+) transhydrogenase (Re/Si-specific) subunit beta [Marixanthomonas sp. SCSIO 43207]